MELKLQNGEKCRINYQDCPCCGNTFNSKARKKTWHHAVPKFLNPETEIEVSICKECHERLNSNYVTQQNTNKTKLVGKFKPESFEAFLNNYKMLRNDFQKKTKDKPKTQNGKFGEGLWLNLVNYLEYLDNKLDALQKDGE